jgi:hypothetical protein
MGMLTDVDWVEMVSCLAWGVSVGAVILLITCFAWDCLDALYWRFHTWRLNRLAKVASEEDEYSGADRD